MQSRATPQINQKVIQSTADQLITDVEAMSIDLGKATVGLWGLRRVDNILDTNEVSPLCYSPTLSYILCISAIIGSERQRRLFIGD